MVTELDIASAYHRLSQDLDNFFFPLLYIYLFATAVKSIHSVFAPQTRLLPTSDVVKNQPWKNSICYPAGRVLVACCSRYLIVAKRRNSSRTQLGHVYHRFNDIS